MMVVLLLSKQYRKLTLRAGEGGVRGGNENQLREQSREEDLKRKTIAEQENRGDQLAEETYGHDRRDTWGNNMIWRRVGVERKKSIQKKMSQKDNTRFSFTAKTVFDKFTFFKTRLYAYRQTRVPVVYRIKRAFFNHPRATR